MKLMVLGGGSCQINFIQRAHALGHTIVLVDYLSACPAAPLADVHEQISTFDIPSVLAAAKQHQIDGIVAIGTDQPVRTAAVVADALGLHFYASAALAMAATNKRVMKQRFAQSHIPTVDFRLIGEGFRSAEISGLSFPAVLKPLDSQGQRGVFLVQSEDEAHRLIGQTLTYSKESTALLETFYPCDEITVNGWASGGEITILSVVDRVTMKNTNRIGICICHNFPSVHLAKYHNEIRSLTDRIGKAFGITDGPIYFQFLIGSDGIKVNEIALRIGGAYEDITIPMISGIDIAGLLLEYTEFGRCNPDALRRYHIENNDRFISTQLFFCRRGRVRSITPLPQLLEMPGMRAARYAIEPGSILRHIENATARAGYFIVEGRSFANMIHNVNSVFDRFEVLSDTGENLIIKYRDYENKYLFYEGEML